MYVYLCKRISIPNDVQLTTLSWNSSKGYIACGGVNGLLKVLKLDPQIDGNACGIAAPTTLTMNETLDEHKSSITNITWNEKFDKMTSSDESGVIIVWILFKVGWHQEMINNSNPHRVNGIKWNCDGEKICIIYEDGSVIMGSVDGSRLWANTIPDRLTHIEWSPDSRLLIFGLLDGQAHIYDNGGNKISTLKNFCKKNDTEMKIISIEWYKGEKGYMCLNCPCLVICYSNGCCQIMRNESDECPVLIDTGLEPKCISWNGNGTVLAIGGYSASQITNKDFNLIQFYDPFGYHLRTLKVPSTKLHACSWDSESLRLAIAVDSSIYFANIRPSYKWTYCDDTVIYGFTRPDQFNYCIVFWNSKLDSYQTKYFHNLKAIISNGNLCTIIHKQGYDEKSKYNLLVCNSIGTPIDSKDLLFEPVYYTMTESFVIVASHNMILSWQFKKPETLLSIESQVKRKSAMDKHVDNTNKSIDVSEISESNFLDLMKKVSDDQICAICSSRRTLIVATESGKMKQYSMPSMEYETTHTLRNKPFKLEINCTGTRVASIDFGGVVTFFDLEKSHSDSNGVVGHGAMVENFEYKDVWDMKFAQDNPLLFVMMEKTKLRIVQDTQSEEPVVFSGYICEFKELEVKAVLLDEIMNDYEKPSKSTIITLETKKKPLNQNHDYCLLCVLNIVIFSSFSTYILDLAYIAKSDRYQRIIKHRMVFMAKNARVFLNIHSIRNKLTEFFSTNSDQLFKTILRDCRKLLEQGQLEKVQEFIDDNPHNKMWKMLADYALEKLDLVTADQVFVRFSYYPGIKFVKKLQKLQNNNLKMAEVSVYFGRYEEAERRFLAMDRPDLAKAMLKSIGDWSKVLQMMKSGNSASDAEMNEAWNSIGQHYFDKHNWTQAVNYFTQGRCYEKLVECFYYLEDYTGLERLAELLPENSPLLSEIAEIFVNAGMCEQAVFTFLKNDQLKNAIDCCIQLNHWQTAIDLAKNREITDINEMLTRYAKHLLDNKCYVQAVELYRRAGCFLDAAKIIQKNVEEESRKSKNYLKLKKMSVLVGLLIEQHHEQNKMHAKARLKSTKGQEAASALNGMLHEEFLGISETRLLDRPWHWAEAYHFYLLAQRQLFQKFFDAAMRTAKLLSEYEDVIDPRDIYSLIAICAIHNRAFGTSSKAFTKLETLDSFSEKEKSSLTSLTFKIFTKYSPTDPPRIQEYEELENSFDGDSKIPICIVLGQPIIQGQFWMCPVCKHSANEDEMNKLQNCPLCHSPA